MVQPTSDLLAAALDAAARGWRVFPLCPNAKAPAVRSWQSRATTCPNRIRRCWTSGQPWNIAIATGPSGLVVLDLDTPKDGQDGPTGHHVLTALADELRQDVPDTFTVRTGRGGTHLYYAAPEAGSGRELRNTASKLGHRIDTRAVGGYVVAPGSTVCGRAYLVHDDQAPVPLPGWLADRLGPAPVPDARPVTVALMASGDARRDAYLRSAVDAETRRVRQAQPGGRNHALFVAAVALGQLAAGGAIAPDLVRDVLTDAATPHIAQGAFSAREADQTITSGLRRGATRPRTLPASDAA